jgi:hypothetical protein
MKTIIEKERIGIWIVSALPSIAFVLAFALLPAGSATSQENNKPPKGWFFGSDRTNYKFGLDTTISQHGKNSATLESIVENPAEFCTMMQNMAVKNFSGKRVKMTGYIKSQGTDVIGSMWMRIDDIGNKVTADFDNMMDRPVTGNSDWTKCEIVFDVPERCMIAFGFILSGSGKIWVDNVSFEIVSSTTPKTANNLNQPFPEEYLNQLKEIPQEIPENPPVNLDFEEVDTSKVVR